MTQRSCRTRTIDHLLAFNCKGQGSTARLPFQSQVISTKKPPLSPTLAAVDGGLTATGALRAPCLETWKCYKELLWDNCLESAWCAQPRLAGSRLLLSLAVSCVGDLLQPT